MELIQNWTDSDKKKLTDFIIESVGSSDYRDICVVGSRIFGGFDSTSDIDVVVFVDDPTKFQRSFHYYDGVPNPESPYKNFPLSIVYANYANFDNHMWMELDKALFLPKYSLITNTYHKGNPYHITYHTRLRQLIKNNNNFIDIKAFRAENDFLLTI